MYSYLSNHMRLFLFTIILLCSYKTYSQGSDHIRFTIEDGLPSNTIFDLHQDKRGFLWIATDKGISRFDGYSFQNYSTDNGLPTNEIWMFHQDTLDRIWLLNSKDAGYFIRNDSIQNISLSRETPLTPNAFILHPSGIALRRMENFEYVKGDSIFLINYDDPLIKEYALDLKDDFLHNVTIGTPDMTEALSMQLLPEKSEIVNILSTRHKSQKQYYIISNSTDLIKFNKYNLSFEHWDHDSLIYSYEDNNDLTLYQPKIKGDIVHIDHSKGYLEYNYKERTIKEKYLLEYNTELTRSINIDGLIYSGSKNGLLIKSHSLNISNITDKGITDICFTEFNKIYISDKRAFDAYAPSLQVGPDTLSNIYLRKAENNCYVIYNNVIQQYGIDGVKSMIIKNSTINDLDEKSQSDFHTDYVLNSVRGFYATEDVILKSSRYAIFRILLSKGSVQEVQLKRLINLNDFCKWRNNIITISNDGIFILNDDLSLTKIIHELDGKNLQAVDIHNDKLVIGTFNRGIYIYNDELIHIKPSANDEPNNVIIFNEKIFYNTRDAIVTIDLETNHYDRLSLHEFISKSTITKLDICRDTLFYLSADGILFNIPLEQLKSKVKRVDLTIKINNSKTDRNKITPLSSSSFELNFEVISVTDFGNLTYHYRMIPGDTNWIETTSRKQQFTNIAPGKYKIEAKCSDLSGNESNIEDLWISIPIPWYNRWEFYSFLTLLTISISLFVIHLRNKRIRAKEHEEMKLNQQFAELQLQALRSQMNPHFVFNALAAIQSFIRQSDKEAADDYLSQFARLIRSFLNHSQSKTIRIREELSLLQNYIELENMRFSDQIELTISVEESIDTFQRIPSLLLQPFVENAINHGLFHKNGLKMLKIHFKQENEAITVTIEDNGIGRIASRKLNEKSRPDHESKGMKIIDNRIETINSTGEFFISYHIEDTLSNELTGTKVIVQIKQL